MSEYPNKEQLESGLDFILQSPDDLGSLEMIVIRPAENERKILESGELSIEKGLVGDNWATRGSKRTKDGSANPDQQLNIMNSRSIALIAGSKDNWKLAGDQLFIDLNLSDKNLPPGSRLGIGNSIIEITDIPHNGCKKFATRFGVEAVKFANSKTYKEYHLRGVNAKIVRPGSIRVGDIVKKL